MRVVLAIFVLLLSSSLYALRVEDGLRIRFSHAITESSTSTPHKTAIEFITIYLDALKHKELLELSTLQVKLNADELTQAKIKAEIDQRKNSELKEANKRYALSIKEKATDQTNYTKAKKRLEDTLHVEIDDIKLPLIKEAPKSLEESISLALNQKETNQQKEMIVENVTQRWREYREAKKSYELNNIKDREKIKRAYSYRVATFNLLATNRTFIDTILSRYDYIAQDNSIMKLYFKEKKRKEPNKKRKKRVKTVAKPVKKPATKVCFKVDASILNAREEESVKSKIVHRYNKGDIICTTKNTPVWIETKHGWCSKNYLKRVKSKP